MTAVILIVFALGYAAIAFEHQIKVNKTATALFLGVICWTLYALDASHMVASIPEWFLLKEGHDAGSDLTHHYIVDGQLLSATGEIAQILFFLMSAMVIVELVDANEGFSLITSRIRAKTHVQLLWLVSWCAFFLSSVLDNLTTTIIMISLLRKLVGERESRMFFAGIVVIAANAGGAWTVIGDVTTTMLWIKGRIGAVEVMGELFLAGIVCLLVPLLGMSYTMRGRALPAAPDQTLTDERIAPWQRGLFLTMGVLGLLSVPVFKFYTHLPPFMGIVLSLSVLWILSELISHRFDESIRSSTGVLAVLKRVDMSSVLFFLGILLAVGALSAAGILESFAVSIDAVLPSRDWVAILIGLVSAVVDNVPLVAAGIEMYDLQPNDRFWMLLAYCAGTGGSCLIIGSAAGVAAMGLEHLPFTWYLRNISPWALLGYASGVVVYLVQSSFY